MTIQYSQYKITNYKHKIVEMASRTPATDLF